MPDRNLLSIIQDALSAFEDTITAGDRDWASYPAPTDDPDATLRQYLRDIKDASFIITSLMPGPRITPEVAREMVKVLDTIDAMNDNTSPRKGHA